MNEPPCPQALLTLQQWFAGKITALIEESDAADIPLYKKELIEEIREKIAPSPHLTSEERLGIYQQQYWWRLLNLLQEIYPSLVALFGYEEFNLKIAEPYLLAHPPSDWFISHVGSALPKWLKKKYRGKERKLALALAEIDLAHEHLVFKDLLPKIDPSCAYRCETEVLYLQPTVLLLSFEEDYFPFRKELLSYPPEYWKEHPLPKMEKRGKEFFVLFLIGKEREYESVSESRFKLLQAFQKGAKLTDLLDLLDECDDMVEWFETISSRGWLTFYKNNKR